MQNKNLIAKVITGSHLYGLDTPSSDFDYKEVFLPSLKSLILKKGENWTRTDEKERGPITENNSGTSKVDFESFSLQRFSALLIEGQALAIEMVCAPPDKWLLSTSLWTTLHHNRKRFLSRRLSAFCGFARAQSVKYCTRAERYDAANRILEVLKTAEKDGVERLYQIWDVLPTAERSGELFQGIEQTLNPNNRNADQRTYSLFGRQLQATVRISHALEVIQRITDGFGSRVKNAKDIGNKDWKALSHAFRVAYQVREIVQTGDLRFPAREVEYLALLKAGKIDYVQGTVEQRLNDLIAECEALIADPKCPLPARGDEKWLDEFILGAYSQCLKD